MGVQCTGTNRQRVGQASCDDENEEPTHFLVSLRLDFLSLVLPAPLGYINSPTEDIFLIYKLDAQFIAFKIKNRIYYFLFF